ncbi:MAG: prenyltransferase/squalene oxidase repeat-containing protein, partial [Planctomycetota bacterium]
MNRRTVLFLCLALAGTSFFACGKKDPPPPPPTVELAGEDWRVVATHAVKKGLDYLASRDPKGEGKWMRSAGITAVVLLAHFESDVAFSKRTHPSLWKGLTWLRSLQKPSGAIFHPQEGNANYVTSVATLAMILSGDSAFSATVDLGKEYLLANQMTDGPFKGGFGYQDKAKVKDKPYADIVNTEFALEALHRAGLPADHEAWKRAVAYMQNSQHNSEYNKAAWVSDIGDFRGGFVYHPAGESKAGTGSTEEGEEVLLPYGSVTYAGIKSMIYAHLDRDDPRVKAAVDWIRRHWTLEENPGFDVKRDPNL